jgi:hypothetical protein
MIENRKNYRLDVDKIKTLKDVKNVLDSIRFVGYYDADDPNDENYYLSEYFTILEEPQKLTFPAPRRSIEELSQELEEKFDALIKTTKEKFECSNYFAGKRYNKKFDEIIGNFEYAQKNGEFPPKLLFTVGNGLTANDFVTSAPNLTNVSYVIKQGEKHEGYYTFGNRRYFKYYMPDKPNMIVRFFMKTCLGFWWVDEKDT